MICESEDRLTGRVIIVVARTTDYCFYAIGNFDRNSGLLRHICVCSFSADNNVIIKALHKKRKGERK